MYCENCGNELKGGEKFCSVCGTAVGVVAANSLKATAKVPKKEKSKNEKSGKIVLLVIAAVVVAAVGVGSALYLNSDGYQCKKNMKLAQESYAAGDYEEALEYYQEALKLDDTLLDAYLVSADIYAETGEYEEAVSLLKKGIRKNKSEEETQEALTDKLVEVYQAAADAYIETGAYAQAYRLLEEGIESTGAKKLSTKKVEVYQAEAEYYLSAGNYDEALAVIDRGIEDTGDSSLTTKKAEISAMVDGFLAELDSGSDSDSSSSADSGSSTTDSGSSSKITDYGSGTITIWVAENTVDFTQAQAAAFFEANPDMAGYSVTVEPVGEGDAAGNMLVDVEGGADIFGFAQDQITRLVSAGALSPIVGDNANFVSSQNDAGAASAALVGDVAYAYPMTSDNGYFLYYDSSVITDPSSLEQIIADCEAAGKNFYMEINSGWYQPAFFFATGCTLTYDTDSNGNFTACNVDYATDKGVVAFKEIIELASSPAFQNGSSISAGSNIGAIVDGTWDSGAAQDIFGANYACAKLPSFTGSEGNTYQLSGFGGFKLLGIKPQVDPGKLAVCHALAQYLTGTDVQLARYTEVGWGPSNLTAQQDAAVQADAALSALAEQLAYTIPQGNYPGDYWDLATALGDDVISGTISTASSDEELLNALQKFQNTCISYAQ